MVKKKIVFPLCLLFFIVTGLFFRTPSLSDTPHGFNVFGPPVGGNLKVLFVGDNNRIHALSRELGDLVGLDYSILPSGNASQSELKAVQETEWDAVWLGSDIRTLPSELKETILGIAEKGTGIVYTGRNTDIRKYMTGKLRQNPQSIFDITITGTGRRGKGSVVAVQDIEMAGFQQRGDWTAAAAYSLGFVSGKYQDVQVMRIRIPRNIPFEDLETSHYRVDLSNHGPARKLNIRQRYRSTLNHIVYETVDTFHVQKGRSYIELDLVPLPSDRYSVDIILESEDGALTMGGRHFNVTSFEKILAIKLMRNIITDNDAVAGSVRLVSGVQEGMYLEMQAFDMWGRILAFESYDIARTANYIPFSLYFRDLTSNRIILHACLYKNNMPIHTLEKKIYVNLPKVNEFSLYADTEMTSPYGFHILSEQGFSGVILEPGQNSALMNEAASAKNLDIIPKITIMANLYPNRLFEYTGLNGRDYLQDFRASRFQMLSEKTVLQESNPPRRVFSDFTRYLEREYENVSLLNSKAGTTFSSFKTVDTNDENLEIILLEFRRNRLIKITSEMSDMVRSIDRTSNVVVDRMEREAGRYLLVSGSHSAGYYVVSDSSPGRNLVWESLFSGARGIVMQNGSECGRFLANIPEVARTGRDVLETGEGIAALLNKSSRYGDRIAVLVSTRNSPDIDLSIENFMKLLGGKGATPDLLNMKSLEEVMNLTGKPPSLIYFHPAKVQSAHDWELLSEYVRRGGILVADVYVGDKLEESTEVEEIFGIELHDPAKSTSTGFTLRANGETSSIEEILTVNRRFKTAGAKRLISDAEGSPAVVVNEYGEGKAVLSGIEMKRTSQTAGIFADWILQNAGIENGNIMIRDAEGLTADRYKLYRFEDKSLRYIGVIAEHGSKGDYIEIADGRKAIYDVRTRTFLGFTNRISLDDIYDGRAGLYALLPYRVRGLTLNLDTPVVRHGEYFSFNVGLDTFENIPAGDHLISVSLFSPDGSEIKSYRRDLKMDGGQLKGNILFALNDPVGSWKIRVRDVISGRETERTFILARSEKR